MPPEKKERQGTRERNEKRPGKFQGVNQKSIGIFLSLNTDLAKGFLKYEFCASKINIDSDGTLCQVPKQFVAQ
jgi:hypothetical protein